jgi:hypothetical protein
MLTPADKPAATAPAPLSGAALVQEIKKELKRVGCYAGRLDDQWTNNETRASVQKFARYAKLTTTPTDPGMDFLEQLRGKADRVCPLECNVRQVEKDGQCIAKTCPGGQRLDAAGNCAAAPKGKQEPRKSSRKCFVLGGKSYCE